MEGIKLVQKIIFEFVKTTKIDRVAKIINIKHDKSYRDKIGDRAKVEATLVRCNKL